jgi:hypothetical protein
MGFAGGYEMQNRVALEQTSCPLKILYHTAEFFVK